MGVLSGPNTELLGIREGFSRDSTRFRLNTSRSGHKFGLLSVSLPFLLREVQTVCIWGSGFGVQGLGSRIWGRGFGVWGFCLSAALKGVIGTPKHLDFSEAPLRDSSHLHHSIDRQCLTWIP